MHNKQNKKRESNKIYGYLQVINNKSVLWEVFKYINIKEVNCDNETFEKRKKPATLCHCWTYKCSLGKIIFQC